MMKLYIIAGEASGDLHGANLIKAIREQQPDVSIRCWGGDKMREAGADLVKHYRDLAFMGFAEVLMNIRTIMRNFKLCKADIEAFQPDALILIDYPGFNLRMAEWAHEKGIPVHYYISPQIWAWKQNRVYKIRKVVDRMYCVLPFEKDFYARFDYNADFVGHPLLDEIAAHSQDSKEAFYKKHGWDEKPIIALLPGSRKQEISSMLPAMLSVRERFPNHRFVIAGAPGQQADYYQQFTAGHKDVPVVFGATYDILHFAEAGLITSGTATLEAGLFALPQVVCYKANPISYAIARRIIKVKYISLVNLILDKPAVRELIQHDLNTDEIGAELDKLLNDASRKEKMRSDYADLHRVLGGTGASQRTASLLLKSLKNG